MINQQNDSLYHKSIETFGEYAEVKKAMEELGELTVAISHLSDDPTNQDLKAKVADEMADVMIASIEKMKVLFGISDVSILKRKKFKLDRLERRICQRQSTMKSTATESL